MGAARADICGEGGAGQGRRPREVPRVPLVRGCVRHGASPALGECHRPLHGNAVFRDARHEVQGLPRAAPRPLRPPGGAGDDAGRGEKRGPPSRNLPAGKRHRRPHRPGAAHVGRACAQGGDIAPSRDDEPISSPAAPSAAWVMPWERRPQWEYLPHLTPCVVANCADADASGAGGGISRQDIGAAGGRRRIGSRDASATGACEASGREDNVATGNRGAEENLHDAQQTVDGTHGGEAVDGIRGRAHSPGGRLRAPAARAGGDEAVAISGQVGLPGSAPGSSGYTSERSGMHHQGEAYDMGHPVGDGVGRAQARLDQQNAIFARSFADHAERVAKKARSFPAQEHVPAAERLAALRRRVSQRLQTLRGGPEGSGSTHPGGTQGHLTSGGTACTTDEGAEPESLRSAGDRGELSERVWTSEVPKMHSTHSSGSVHGLIGQRHEGGGQEFVGGDDSVQSAAGHARRGAAVEAAASLEAWHSVEDRNGLASG